MLSIFNDVLNFIKRRCKHERRKYFSKGWR